MPKQATFKGSLYHTGFVTQSKAFSSSAHCLWYGIFVVSVAITTVSVAIRKKRDSPNLGVDIAVLLYIFVAEFSLFHNASGPFPIPIYEDANEWWTLQWGKCDGINSNTLHLDCSLQASGFSANSSNCEKLWSFKPMPTIWCQDVDGVRSTGCLSEYLQKAFFISGILSYLST